MSDSVEGLRHQYDRIAAEYINIEGFLWQMPSLAFTIASALTIATYQFLRASVDLDVLALIAIGGFLFIAAQITFKHRFNAAWRMRWMEDIEAKWTIEHVPMGTDKQLNYFDDWADKNKEKGETREKAIKRVWKGAMKNYPRRLIKLSSHELLVWMLLVAAGLLWVAAIWIGGSALVAYLGTKGL